MNPKSLAIKHYGCVYWNNYQITCRQYGWPHSITYFNYNKREKKKVYLKISVKGGIGLAYSCFPITHQAGMHACYEKFFYQFRI